GRGHLVGTTGRRRHRCDPPEPRCPCRRRVGRGGDVPGGDVRTHVPPHRRRGRRGAAHVRDRTGVPSLPEGRVPVPCPRRLLGRRRAAAAAGSARRARLMASIEELQKDLAFTTGGKSRTGKVTFLPEPERAERRFTVISV